MAVTLSADLSLEMYQLPIVVWVMTSWVMSQRNGMTTCYRCDRLSTLISPHLPPASSSLFWFSLHDTHWLSLVCQVSWMPLGVNSTGPQWHAWLLFCFLSKKCSKAMGSKCWESARKQCECSALSRKRGFFIERKKGPWMDAERGSLSLKNWDSSRGFFSVFFFLCFTESVRHLFFFFFECIFGFSGSCTVAQFLSA